MTICQCPECKMVVAYHEAPSERAAPPVCLPCSFGSVTVHAEPICRVGRGDVYRSDRHRWGSVKDSEPTVTIHAAQCPEE